MRSDQAFWPSPETYVIRNRPDRPVLCFAPDVLQATARRFLEGFEGLVTYAVKANDDPAVLANLAAAGIEAFDVASPAEMSRVRDVMGDAVLHYHNPVRSSDEIAAGVQHGIASWSVDCPQELAKLAEVPRADTEIAVRLRLPVKGAAYDFGEKFGADPEAAVALLQEAEAMGFAVSLTFHPGTQCADPEAWAVYVEAAAEVAARAGVRLRRLNVGGGFAAHRGGVAPDLEAIFDRIKGAMAAFGTDRPALVCEPGRAMVSEAFTAVFRVKALRREGAVFLNDGIYGALAEWRDIGAPGRIAVMGPDGTRRQGKGRARIVFGPTCDSLDRLPEPLALPDDMAEGDYLMVSGMGAYTAAISTGFNGYGRHDLVTVTGS
ncbi:type III PLP-dependent enzyme [Shimia sp. FJ5]|uniref:type III PLP-dependent enzyme n=1 Tax=Shimia sp. FJ5 TaxID=3079054 RepID=UPI0026142D59|nr:type III PLP-dependent enzyme [Shimia sp. FJ5]MDV4146028.1 type III PLP-dependent enzyme [Shimia sp. FJ5]